MSANPIKKLAGETAIYGISSILGRLLNWLLVPYYTRVFFEGEYGVVVNIYAYIAILLVLLTYGMETSFFRYAGKSKDPQKVYSTSLLSLLFTSLLFVVFILSFDTTLAGWIDYQSHPEYIRWVGMIIAIDAVTALPFARLRLEKRPLRFAVIKILNIVSFIGLNIFFLSICPKIIEAHPRSVITAFYNPATGVGYVFISNLIASAITLLLLFPQIVRIQLKFDGVLLRKMLNYGFPILLVGIAGMINQSIDKILLKELLPAGTDGMAATGIYGANYKLGILMALFIQAFKYAFEPFFFSQQDGEKSKAIYADVMKYVVIFGLFIFLGIMFYIDIIKLLLGSKFHAGLNVVPWILLGNLFLGIYYTLSLWYKLTDRTRYGAYLAFLGAVVTIGLNIILVPLIGYTGAAIAAFFCYLTMVVASYLLGQRFYPVNYNLKTIGFYFVVALVLFYASQLRFFENQWVTWIFNTGLLFIFAGITVAKEKPDKGNRQIKYNPRIYPWGN